MVNKFAIMDNKGIIEDFDTEEEAVASLGRIREENDIVGDLKLVKVLGCYN